MGEIKLIQDELTALSKWRNSSGLFMNEKTGEVPEIGQEILSSLCEQAWDLVHDCLVEMDHQREATTAKARKASGSGANALHRLQEIRDVLLNYAYGAEQATLPILSAIGGSLNVLAKPLESGASKLLSTARSAYQYLGEAMKGKIRER